MNYRILFLGTGGDTYIIGKQERASGGIILNIENDQYHIDPGPGALVMAKIATVNIRENTAVFVSSNKLVAANDLNAVISAMTHDGLDKKGVLVCPSTVISGDPDESAYLNTFYKNCVEKVISVDNIKKIGINQTEIEIISLENYAVAYKFITKRFSLSYVPATGYSNNILEGCRDSDILILTVTEPRNSMKKDYLNVEDAEKIIQKLSPQLTILTGFGTKMIQAEPLYEARELQKSTGSQVISARDSMTINPLSFSATVRQSNLRSF
jgi:ribonuclease BN (tRNA processing enzyme)